MPMVHGGFSYFEKAEGRVDYAFGGVGIVFMLGLIVFLLMKDR